MGWLHFLKNWWKPSLDLIDPVTEMSLICKAAYSVFSKATLVEKLFFKLN